MIKKGLLAGLANLVFGFFLNTVVGMVFPPIMAAYSNTNLFRPWTDPLMMVYFGYPIILGFALYYLWEKVGKPQPLEFAKLYFIVATIPGMFITYTSFQVSLAMVLLWTVVGFGEAYLSSWLFKKVK